MKMKTNRKVKKLFSYVLTAAMVITAVTPAFAGKVKAVAAGLTLTEQSGWLESAYVEWQPVKNAEGYVAYVKEASASDDAYEKLDDTLIRQYADYWRADALGLKEGSYVMKVTAVLKDGKTVSESTSSLEVEKYDRSGFAFSENSKFQTASGAYNDDGTLKKDAQVIYVTPETAKTCTAVVNGKEVTGFQSILDAKQSAGTKDTSPLDFRIVGCVTADDVDHFSSSAEGIQLKGKSAYTEMNITIEGVGEDAAVQGFGFLVRNSGNVEFRNFAVMAFMDDGISLDTKNCNIWVHNMDIFYGSTGGDSDQAKGDGSVDIKGASTNVTVSYVHFWDSGKCSLCGMSDSAEFLVTYHHNWFDHSDSRHPRIRVASVHIYNNYFDGNAKYGVGTTKGSSAFVEANYYRNCKNPMMSSMQGTDALGQGTFSGENGGMIKAYNNITVGASSLIYANSDAGTAKADAVSFDAYLASSREETVPSSYKTVAGATTYNNFDTSSAYDLGVAEEDIDDPQDVPSIVTKYAGRMNGGDFDWTFQESDDTNYSVDTALKAKVVNYKSSVLAIGGYKGVDVEPSTTEKATESTTKATEATTKATESTTKATESTTKATESTTKATEATTKATESTTEAQKPTHKPTEAPTEVTKPTEKPTEAPTQKPETDEKVIYEMRQDADGNWHYYANDTIAADYCGMAVNEYGWWYIKNGDVDFTYTGMACNEYGWWYFNNGQLDTTFYGLANNEYGTWFYTDGQLNFGFTGMIIPDDEWLYVQNGQVLTDYTGMALNEYGWWYFKDGKVDFTYTGMAVNEYGWWYFSNGQIDFGYNGFATNEYGTWLFTDGILNTGFTGMTLNGDTWVYVTDGYISNTYTGMALNDYSWWYFNNGVLDLSYTGMALNEYGWWYFNNGLLDLTFTGVGSNEYGDWYFKDGTIAFDYSGTISFGGQDYTVTNGYAVKA